MIIAVDFDGVVVQQDRPYDDLETPLRFVPGALEALRALKNAGHNLLLWSARASKALLVDPYLDPLVRAQVRPASFVEWEKRLPLHQARMQQMLDFVDERLPGVFDAIDDGAGGKPQVDLFIDDRALRLGPGPGGMSWQRLVWMYGEKASVEERT